MHGASTNVIFDAWHQWANDLLKKVIIMSLKSYMILLLSMMFLGALNNTKAATAKTSYKSIVLERVTDARKQKSQKIVITDPQKILVFLDWLRENKIDSDYNHMGNCIYLYALLLSKTEQPPENSSIIKNNPDKYIVIMIFDFLDKNGNKLTTQNGLQRFKELDDFFDANGKPFLENNKGFYINIFGSGAGRPNAKYESLLND